MAKRTRKSKRILNESSEFFMEDFSSDKPKKPYFLITEIIFAFIFVACCGLSCFFYLRIQDFHKQEKKINATYLQKKIEYQEEESKYTTLNNQLEYYQNIDDSIEKTKKEYFEHILSLENAIEAGNTDKKIAYLTFDDGPYYNTYRVFDILDQYGVKATFFTTNINGEYCFDNEDANCWIRYKEYIDRGHTIANHTYTHAIFRGLYSSTDSFMDAVIKQEEHVKNLTGGYVTNILRFPGGSSTARGLKDSIIERLRERGYGWVDWSANDGDGGSLSSEDDAWNNFVSTINSPMEVILYHDYSNITTNVLPRMIEYLQNNGYEIYPLFYESHMINK